jgi:hypothetical protein
MRTPPAEMKCEKSAFNYTLEIKPDGSINIKDKNGKCIKTKGQKKTPPIKKIVNTRTITIMEAKGSQWIYLKPPGRWYLI